MTRAHATLALMAAALLAAPAAQAQAPQTFIFTVSDYASPGFEDVNGTFYFIDTGEVNQTLALTPGVPQDFFLDSSEEVDYGSGPTNSNTDPPTVFTGTATSTLTFSSQGASLGSQTISNDYLLDGTTPGVKFPTYAVGAPVIFDVGGGQTLTVTPSGALSGFRTGTALLSPEPAQPAALALGALGLAGLGWKARKRRTVPQG